MKSINFKIKFIGSLFFICLFGSLYSQNDTMYVMKGGLIINKQSIKMADVDSIIFYRPMVSEIQTVSIPAGSFTMGSPLSEANRQTDETQFNVTLSAFRMSKYEITNSQFAAFLNKKNVGSDGKNTVGNYPNQALIHESAISYDYGLHFVNSKWVPVSGYENAPVVYVTWFGAMEYARYVGGSLPTEAQWEYACRGGTITPFYTGVCIDNNQANYWWLYPYGTCTNSGSNGLGRTLSVGTYPANAFGLFDMHGNVWEWCSDWYGVYPSTDKSNPIGADVGTERVFRGGSWREDGRGCRSARRGNGGPGSYTDAIGFRVVFN